MEKYTAFSNILQSLRLRLPIKHSGAGERGILVFQQINARFHMHTEVNVCVVEQ